MKDKVKLIWIGAGSGGISPDWDIIDGGNDESSTPPPKPKD